MDNFKWTDELVAEYSLASQELTLFEFKRRKQMQYEILSFEFAVSGLGASSIIHLCGRDGTYGLYSSPLEHFLNSPSHKIHSVRRNSDGEVFTIGDKIKSHPNPIVGFIVGGSPNNPRRNDGCLWLSTDSEKSYGCEISSAQKKNNKLILTTVDGKQVFEGDTIWHLCTMEGSWKATPTKARNEIKDVPMYFKYFSTEQLAKDYISENKPCLSFNDLIKSSLWHDGNSQTARMVFKISTISELVKSKL